MLEESAEQRPPLIIGFATTEGVFEATAPPKAGLRPDRQTLTLPNPTGELEVKNLLALI